MRNLNPMLHQVLWDWYQMYSKDHTIGKFQESRDTLTHNRTQIISRLIHEFPKSYVESYNIYSDLFNQNEIFEIYDHLEEINILSLATGSGGDVFGLIQALETYFIGKKINVFSVEGNQDALKNQENLFKKHIELSLIHNKVKLFPIVLTIDYDFFNLKTLFEDVYFKQKNAKSFDIIQSSKWMTEDSVREKIRFYDYYRLINQWLGTDRIATLLEYADPKGPFKFEQQLPFYALDDFAFFCKQNRRFNQLAAITPTPCIARRMNNSHLNQCRGCISCYDEFEVITKLPCKKTYKREKTYAFVMKFVTGKLAAAMTQKLQDVTVEYLTVPSREGDAEKYCCLDSKESISTQGNGFRLSQKKTKK